MYFAGFFKQKNFYSFPLNFKYFLDFKGIRIKIKRIHNSVIHCKKMYTRPPCGGRNHLQCLV